MDDAGFTRRLPIGAEPVAGGVHFRVWAPRRRTVHVVLHDADAGSHTFALAAEADGFFSGVVAAAAAGTRYAFLLDGQGPFPDPASRFQPEGPHGPSQVVDPGAYRWCDEGWRGIPVEDAVIYEMHIGTFTPEGTWAAAALQLPPLADLGITLLEVLPVADFPGAFGWGYDGVNLFAPTRLYGGPDDFRRFVDEAHAAGIGVVLDVVYNHLGPDGNFLGQFSENYFTDRYETEWGWPFDLDGPHSSPVREYILANVEYWVREFHVDGLRLDATQAIFDAARNGPHIIAEIARTARASASGRAVHLIGENEPQKAVLVLPGEAGGYALDALWNDDWHHSATVALTGRSEAYYSDHLGAPQEFVSAAKYGFLYQGQHYGWQEQRRGTPALGLPPHAFVNFLQNHDQVANSARGDRIHRLTGPAQLRAMTALLVLGPATPMLFQGQEFASSAPFLYFADHHSDLAREVCRGRRRFLEQFPSIASTELQEQLDDPADPRTFQRCKLDFQERDSNAGAWALHRDLLRLRRHDPTFRRRGPGGIDGAVLGAHAFALRFFGAPRDGGEDRLLLVNLGREMRFSPAPEPLLAPPAGSTWQAVWTSEDARYGGLGHADPEDGQGRWTVPGQCAVVLVPRPAGSGASDA